MVASLSENKIMKVRNWLALFMVGLDLAAAEICVVDITPTSCTRCGRQNTVGDWLGLLHPLFCGKSLLA